MKRAFQIFGTAVCLLFAYASYVGWTVVDSMSSENWGPQGHTVYHK